MADNEQISSPTQMPSKDAPAFVPPTEPYLLGPDSKRQPEVPQGEVRPYHWAKSAIYPETDRDYWVYVPAQYDGSAPAGTYPRSLDHGSPFLS